MSASGQVTGVGGLSFNLQSAIRYPSSSSSNRARTEKSSKVVVSCVVCLPPEAKEAVDGLIQWAKRGNYYTREAAAKALERIDPQTARKLDRD